MKRVLDKIRAHFQRYLTLNRRVNAIVTFKSVIKSVVGAFSVSFLILLIPVLFTINLFIYSDLHLILSLLLVLLAVSWSLIYYAVYYRLLANYEKSLEPLNTRIMQWTESIGIALLLSVTGIIVIVTLF
jgi:hypothetical protein